MRRARKMTTISAKVRISKPGKPIWSKKPVLGMAAAAGVPLPGMMAEIPAVEVICCAS